MNKTTTHFKKFSTSTGSSFRICFITQNWLVTFIEKDLSMCFFKLRVHIAVLNNPEKCSRTMAESITATNTLYFTSPHAPKFEHTIFAFDPISNQALDPITLPRYLGFDL